MRLWIAGVVVAAAETLCCATGAAPPLTPWDAAAEAAPSWAAAMCAPAMGAAA